MGHQLPPNKPFERLSIGKCYVQTANERFGDGARQAVICRERAEYGQSIGAAEQPFPWPGEDVEEANDGHQSIYKKVPTMQGYRNNLTALSQKYNLYFVAYRRHIYVYRPRNVPAQALPQVPDLQLAPKPSAAGNEIGGFVDRHGPQLINHIITGFLGREEILLSCFDNGDVIAYYVKDLARWTSTDAQNTRATQTKEQPTPFFHENVGTTAWGLAIHQKTRLIAVTSNRHEVTVFAFGLLKPTSHGSPITSPEESGYRYCDPPACLFRRDRNWRIVVLLGPECENTPNVCFVDDENGEAEKVCAIDIGGSAWLADIWKPKQPCIRIEPLPKDMVQSEESYPDHSRGWGIFAVPESSFMLVTNRSEMFGLPINEAYLTCMQSSSGPGRFVVNTVKCLNGVPGNPHPLPQDIPTNVPHLDADPWFGLHGNLMEPFQAAMDSDEDEEDEEEDEEENEEEEEEEEEDEEEEEEDDEHGEDDDIEPAEDEPEMVSSDEDHIDSDDDVSSDPSVGGTGRPRWQGLGTWVDDRYKLIYNKLADVGHPNSLIDRLDMIYHPHSGAISEHPRDHRSLMRFLTGAIRFNFNGNGDPECLQKLDTRLHLLRTYEKDIELYNCGRPINSEAKETSVLCGQALLSGRIHPSIRHLFTATSRLSMIAHMPEISAVAVGSPIGRVAILTLTRKPACPEHDKIIFQNAFRVDWILPTKEEEKQYRKTLRPLHGLAVGPVYDNVDDLRKRARLPCRYRLMLHYRTHDILSYEITRDKETKKLCIF